MIRQRANFGGNTVHVEGHKLRRSASKIFLIWVFSIGTKLIWRYGYLVYETLISFQLKGTKCTHALLEHFRTEV